MKRLLLGAFVLVLTSFVLAGADEGAPKSSRWMLKLEHGPLKIVSVQTPSGATATYHYMTLKVTNPTALPRDWYPRVSAITDTGQVKRALPFQEAMGAVRRQEKNDDLVGIGSTLGKIQPGKTLDTVAVFGPLDPLYDMVRVRIIGLADPIAIYKVQRYDVTIDLPEVVYAQINADTGKPEKVKTGVLISDVAYIARNKLVLAAMRKALDGGELPKPTTEYWEVRERRTYEMVYRRLGDEFRPDDDVITKGKEYWTIVGDVRLQRQIHM